MSGKMRDFVGGLALEIGRRYPSAIANSPEPLVSPRRRFEIFEQVFARARQFTEENKLGRLSRSRMGGALRWRLREMGYDEKFIEMATEHLAAACTPKTQKR